MQIKSIKLGDYVVENNVFLAPMAGYTDYSFRHIALKTGYGLSFTELISAKGVYYKNKGTAALILSTGDEDKTAVQIFGSEPYFMRYAIESEELKNFKIVDINMGCPVPKVYKNGEGSALLKDIKKAGNIVNECSKSDKIITVKIRTGLKVGDDFASEFCKMAEDNGAKLVTIHGRSREEYYSGEPNYNAIYNAKKSVSIPIIANGGIFSKSDADKMIDKTGADGVMIARGSLYSPFIACDLIGREQPFSKKDFILNHLKTMSQLLGDYKSAVFFRKFVPYYFKGIDNIKDFKMKLLSSNSAKELIRLLEENM